VASLTAIARRVLLVLGLLLVDPTVARGADPTSQPGAPGAATCAERYPEDGPAGVDLRLGCIVSEVVGLYTPGQTAPPPPISTYAISIAVFVLLLLASAALVLRALSRRAGQALAPATPGEWWMCPRCRSVNGAARERCYRCGEARPGEPGTSLVTEGRPETPQSFGRGKHT
jgi:hypothetical protein